MADLLDNLGVVSEALGEGNFGLLTDFDGTMSHIAPTPAEASISPQARRCLSALSRYLKLVAVISGRALDDIRDLVGLPDIVYVGNHGLETWLDGHRENAFVAADFRHKLTEARAAVEPVLKEKGVLFEDKGSTATIHYRLSLYAAMIENNLLAALESIDGIRVMRGKMSINIMPPLEVNKGSIIREIFKRFVLKGAVYLGDDVTDIDAFRAVKEASTQPGFKGIAVAVTGKESPPELVEEADFTLDGISGVEAFLNWLRRQVTPPAR